MMPLFPVVSRRGERARDLGTNVLAGWFCASRRAERRLLPDTRQYHAQNAIRFMHFLLFSSLFASFSRQPTTTERNPTDVDTGMNASRLRCEINRLRDRKLGEYLDARRSSPFLTLPFHPPRLYLWSAPVSCKEQQQERTITFGPQRGGRW